MSFCFRILTVFLCTTAVASGDEPVVRRPVTTVPADHAEKAKRGSELFRQKVRSILVTHCLDCHGGKSVKADFDLSTREKLFESGFVEKTAADSHLLQLVTHDAEPHMPLKADRLSDADIEALRHWIDLGAP
ncbi:MAG: c-type cytochrome domain-containing protein, partial [Planctomycetaceae bacterium]